MTTKIIKAPMLGIFGLLGLHSLIVKPSTRLLSLIVLLVIFAQFYAGLNDYFRYLPSFYAFYFPLILYCYQSNLQASPNHLLRYYLTAITIGACLSCYLILPYYTQSPLTVAHAAHQIYGQQYQMRRFSQVFYPKPALVNDIGWVSYLNPHPIYDLLGLSQPDLIKLQYMNAIEKSQFLKAYAIKHNIALAMLWPTFPIGLHWHHLATLSLTSRPITVSGPKVFFYSTAPQFDAAMRLALKKFQTTLPSTVRLKILKAIPQPPPQHTQR